MSAQPFTELPLSKREFDSTTCGARSEYSALLLRSLGAVVTASGRGTDLEIASDWASSGLILLTGQVDSPLQGPSAIPSAARGALDALELLVKKGSMAGLDGARLLSERAAYLQLHGQGSVSANGSCHLLEANDGWIALNLARDEDWQLIPAWLEGPGLVEGWGVVAAGVKARSVGWLLKRGRMLGLPVAPAQSGVVDAESWFSIGARSPTAVTGDRAPLVVDLSSLWAGPLCTHLLEKTGARVIKVESSTRPDGARRGNAAFYDLLNSGKESVVFDLTQAYGVQQLLALLSQADIVIEGSRPRALRHMGIDAERLVQESAGLTWVSITGYGRSQPEADWVAFGDDAAVAAGVASAAANPPVFCGDALADPLTGIHAALAATAFWQGGGGVLLDLNLAGVTAHCLNFHADNVRGEVARRGERWALLCNDRRYEVCSPVTRQTPGVAAPAGRDTDRIIAEFKLPC